MVETSQEEGALLLAAQKRIALLSLRESVPPGTLLRYTHLRRWAREKASRYPNGEEQSALETTRSSKSRFIQRKRPNQLSPLQEWRGVGGEVEATGWSKRSASPTPGNWMPCSRELEKKK